MNARIPLRLFEGVGIEIEYMIVDRDTFDVRPFSDRILHAVAGAYESEVEVGPLAWSNELVLHVIELKTNGPAPNFAGLAEAFQNGVSRIGELLEPHGACLLPTGMHPWMDPVSEARLWPHEHSPVYESFDRIFQCRGHGWANLQATHLNLPFADDDEFGRLHAAIRLVLPLLPALAASSPAADGSLAPELDHRLEVYRKNSRRVPEVTGRVVPEPVFTHKAYQQDLLEPLYRAIAPLDPDGILQHEWLNARGAIARFDRMALEIRVLDVQECPRADIALCALITGIIRGLVEERWSETAAQMAQETEPLARLFEATLRQGERVSVVDASYLACFGWRGASPEVGELLAHLVKAVRGDLDPDLWEVARRLVDRGPLARVIRGRLGTHPTREVLLATWRELGDCLAKDRLFV